MHTLRFAPSVAITAAALLVSLIAANPDRVVAQSESTPATMRTCADASPVATPAMGSDNMGPNMSSPQAGEMDMKTSQEYDFDQMYIDMMIAHHAGIIALSLAALPELTDARLITIAETIIDAQTAEIDELRALRLEFYGQAAELPMDDHMLDMMMMAMPGMGSKDEMRFQMDGDAQVNAFCASSDPDITFIDQVISHHEMAIVSSEMVVQQAIHPEIRAFAERVITDQQKAINDLTIIRTELSK